MSSAIHFNEATIYQHDKEILSNVSLNIDEGEFVYLVGKTGSGKSSFLKTLYADLELKQGSGEIAGFELNSIKRKNISELRRKLGIVFQDFQLLQDRNVYENLKFILKATGWEDNKMIDERIKTVLRQVHLKDIEQKMPYAISGGEQQRVSIARALLNNPEIILADEPTANLDPDTSAEIINLFKEIAIGGKTIVIATHDYYMIKKFPGRILTFEGGKVVEAN
ncbi:MAG: cell division ATP-binding protein FtsE [Bacteroidia bacterium]